MITKYDFLRRIKEKLAKNHFEYSAQPIIGGLSPDFLVKLPGGTFAIIEVKDWAPTEENQLRAILQAKLYRERTGVDSVFVVLRALRHGKPGGLVNQRELFNRLDEISYDIPRIGRKQTLELKRRSAKKPIIFAAMPFDAKYDDTFFVAISAAAESINAVAKRVDKEEFVGDVVNEIKCLIGKSKAVIADLSELNPNVLYETGFAHGRGVPTVHICSTPLKKLPFNVRNWNVINYSVGRTHLLRQQLAERLKPIMST